MSNPYMHGIPEPVIAPNIDQIEPAALAIVKASFVPPKARAAIYSAAGVVAVVCLAIGPAVGGTVGEIIAGVGAGSAALSSGVALSHIPRS